MRNLDPLYAALDAVRARLDEMRPFTPELKAQIQRWFTPRYIYCSSALGKEDVVSARETALFLEAEVVSGGHRLDAFLAIHRHERALRLVEARAASGGLIDPPLILTLHRLLLEGARQPSPGARPGLWKNEESGEARRRGHSFSFAPAAEVGDLMSRLCEDLTKRRAATPPEHPIQTVAWLFFHLHRIQPFASHNGEVSRLLCSALLIHHGYPGLILAPGGVSELLDALVAVDLTVPVSERQPLSPRYDLSSLIEYLAAAVTRTGERLADLVEGRKLDAENFKPRIEADQARQLTRFVGNKLSWRVRATVEVRALHQRCERIVKRLQSDGAIYSLRLERSDVVPSHRADRRTVNALPGGEAGLLGEIEVAVLPSDTMKGLDFPPQERLVIGVGSTQYGLHLVFTNLGDPEETPKVRTGSLRASEWTADALEAMVVRAVDKRRKSYEYELNVLNASRSQRFKLKRLRAEAEEQTHAEAPRIRKTGRPASPREERSTMRLGGLGPAEPPVEF